MDTEKITVGTYTNHKLKPNLNFPIKKTCKKCNTVFDCKNNRELKTLANCPECGISLSYVDDSIFYNYTICRAVVNLGKDIKGKTIKKYFTGKTNDEALQKAKNFLGSLEPTDGPIEFEKEEKNTINQIVYHLKNEALSMGKINQNTYHTNMAALHRLRGTKIATKPISKVTRADIISYFSSIRDYSSSTIKKQYEIISQAFAYAYYRKLINVNYFEGYNKIEKPVSNVETEPVTALTMKEQQKLIQYLTETPYETCKHKFLFLLLLSTGIRIGECLSLSTEDVDIENGKLFIKRTLTKDISNTTIIGTATKTYFGKRTLNLNTMSKMVLEKILEHYKQNKNHLLFCTEKGKLIEEGSINSALKRICKRCGIRVRKYIAKNGKTTTTSDVHTHMLRHTFATRCVEAKIAPAVLKKLMGHTDISTTMKYYVNVDDHFEISEYKNVESYLEQNDVFLSTEFHENLLKSEVKTAESVDISENFRFHEF